MRAFEFFCLRGGQHGSDLDDWLSAEQELSLAADEVLLDQSEERIDISISAARADPGHVILSVSPGSVLILWIGLENGAADQEPEIRGSTLSLLPLPRSADPEKASVEYQDGRVRLHLPYAGDAPSFVQADVISPTFS